MNKFLKGGLLFVGGFVSFGVVLTVATLKSERLRTATIRLISGKVCDMIFAPSLKDRKYVFGTKEKAERVLEQMKSIISALGLVSTADYCELVGATGTFNQTKHGWTDLRDARVIHNHLGYMIKFPPAMYFKEIEEDQ